MQLHIQMQMHADAGIGGPQIAPLPGSWKPLTTLAQAWRAFAAARATAYRPEKHYMRGPGPKWHAKHTQPRNASPR